MYLNFVCVNNHILEFSGAPCTILKYPLHTEPQELRAFQLHQHIACFSLFISLLCCL